MKFRVVISTEGEKTEGGYQQWNEVYSQDIQDLDVPKVVTVLNTSEVRKVVRIRNRRTVAKTEVKMKSIGKMPLPIEPKEFKEG